MEAPAAGVLYTVLHPANDAPIPVGRLIAYLLTEGEQTPAVKPDAAEADAYAGEQAPPAARSAPAAIPARSTPGERRKVSPAPVSWPGPRGGHQRHSHRSRRHDTAAEVEDWLAARPAAPKATPLAKAVAGELGVDLSSLSTPAGGRIYAAQLLPAVPAAPADGDVEIPYKGVQKAMAARMSRSKREVPHFYLSLSADMTNARTMMNGLGYKISLHDLLIRVLAVALAEHHAVNAHVSEDRVVRKGEINVGVAVAMPEGLVVPVVRHAAGKSLRQIAAESAALIEKGRAGRLMPDEYQGGTFTVSNLGMFGIEQFTAIVNQPEAAILAVGRTMDTPVARDGVICIRPMLALSASFDHRAVDGATGARFLSRVRELLENPVLLI